MRNKEKLLIYPFDIQSGPIIRHLGLMNDYELLDVVSPNGWGFVGKDAGRVDGGNDAYINVQGNFNELVDSADAVLFMETYNKLDVQKLVYPKMQIAADRGKNIICTLKLENEFLQKINKDCSDKGKCFKYYNFQEKTYERAEIYDLLDSLYQITVPVIFVFGTSERTQKFEIQLSLRENLEDAGYKVSQVGTRHYCEMFGFHSFPEFMFSTSVTESKKIILFNNYIKKIELEEQPDVIVIGIPGGLMPLNKDFTNHFGVFAFEVCQAVYPDIAIFSSLYEDYLPLYFEKISLLIRYKLGFEVDFFNQSNVKFDWRSSKFSKSMQYLTVDSDFVDVKNHNLKDMNINITNILNKGDALTLTNAIIKRLTGNSEVAPAI